MEKYCTAMQATDDDIIWRMCVAFWLPKATKTHAEQVILFASCNNGYTNAPQCYVIRTLPLLLLLFPDDKMWPCSYHIPVDITSARLLASEGQPLVSNTKQPLTLLRKGGRGGCALLRPIGLGEAQMYRCLL